MEGNKITGAIIRAAIAVHKALGPGLLESSYRACLVYELRTDGYHVECEKALPLIYKGLKLDCGYRVDLIVEREVVVELKCVAQLTPIDYAQLLTYLKLLKLRLGLLINFNVPILIKGVRRLVNG